MFSQEQHTEAILVQMVGRRRGKGGMSENNQCPALSILGSISVAVRVSEESRKNSCVLMNS